MPHVLANRVPTWFFVGLVACCGCSSGPVAVPTSYTAIQSPDKQFQVEHPSDWEVTLTGGAGNLSHCIFESGPARIDISSDVMGSLMAGPAMPSRDPDDEPAVARVHETGKQKFGETFTNYEEHEAKPVQTGLGEGRIAEFTATGALGRKLRGYRATVLSRDRRITAMCSCPVSDWESLKPAFEKVVQSITYGSGR